MEQDGSADFVLLVVDHNSELTGVEPCMRLLHCGNQQFTIFPVGRAPSVWLTLNGPGVLSGRNTLHHLMERSRLESVIVCLDSPM